MGLGGHLSNPSSVIGHEWSRAIQIVATVSSAISLTACLITIYWFFMMRRNFRRNLVLYLVLANFFKSTWYILFSTTAIYRGSISSDSTFCQGTGFLLQASTMACDFTILAMSVHMYLQIFNPTSKLFGHDGLYRFRHTVLALWFVLPTLSGVLAFIKGRTGYISQGPFCTLPIRPYWYRLALAWIPRYIVWACVMFVAVRIYLHVGQGFKVFARQNDKLSSDPGSLDHGTQQELKVMKKRGAPKPGELQDVSALVSSGATSFNGPNSEAPHVNWTPQPNYAADGMRLNSAGQSRRGSRIIINPDGTYQTDHLQVPPDSKGPRTSISSISSWRSSADVSMDEGSRPLSANLAPISELADSNADTAVLASADTPLKKRRQAIQRQIRLLFIYPVTYMLTWIVPLIYHSMFYSDHYAAHPVPILAALAAFFVTFSGFIDCLVFGWREKPWRHVIGSDGTFLGSFMFWNFKRNLRRTWSTPAPGRVPSIADPEAHAQSQAKKAKHWSTAGSSFRGASEGSTRPIMSSHKKTFSGTSDRAGRAAELASERLAMERRDRESRVVTRDSSGNPSVEWFERKLSECISPTREKFGFVDEIHDYEEDDHDEYTLGEESPGSVR